MKKLWQRKLLFWLVWIPAAPLVWGFYVIMETTTRRNYYSMAGVKTSLVRQSVWDKMVLLKGETYRR